MELGYFCLVLHSHLPYVFHPEHKKFLEEEWLFEAISETYIPLIELFERLESNKIYYRITLSLTPTLLAMLSNEYLCNRFVSHIDSLINLINNELIRTKDNYELNKVVQFYHQYFLKIKILFIKKYDKNLIKAFKLYQKKGYLEIITCAATHGYLPFMENTPKSLNAQIKVAVDDYKRYFNEAPKGIWLPECGYFKGLDNVLKENDLEYFFLDVHGIVYGTPRPTFGNYAPIRCSSGVHAFSRDIETSKMVWSKDFGYPGDGYYREFYRDIGYELNPEYLNDWINDDGSRKHTGLKYHRITDRNLVDKMLYDPIMAKRRAETHAEHFLSGRLSQIRVLHKDMQKSPVIISTYDTELFGHWWFEGPWFLEAFFKQINNKLDIIKPITPSEYLKKYPINQTVTPCQSSWGDKGYHEFWLNSDNDWIYKHLAECSNRMNILAKKFKKDVSPIVERALNQALRELLLSESSDWAFIMKTKTTVSYAKKRFKEHVGRFLKLYNDILNNDIDEEWLKEIEFRDNIFPDIDYRIFLK